MIAITRYPEIFILPLTTFLVFYADYRISMANESACTRNSAIRQACWWSGLFFIFGILDRLLLCVM